MERRLIYKSVAHPGLVLEDMDKILSSAYAFNTAFNVTGALFFNGTGFLQVLEGDHHAVQTIYDSVLKDKRHTKIETVEDVAATTRIFPDWAMRLLYIPSSDGYDANWADKLPKYFSEMPENIPAHLTDMIENFEAVSL